MVFVSYYSCYLLFLLALGLLVPTINSQLVLQRRTLVSLYLLNMCFLSILALVLYFYTNSSVYTLYAIVSVLFLATLALTFNDYYNSDSILSLDKLFLKGTGFLALIVMFHIQDLLALFFLLELYSFSSYGLLLSNHDKRSSLLSQSEAILKYFFLASFFSVIGLYGLNLIYFTTGFTTFPDLGLYTYFNNLMFVNLGVELLLGYILMASLFVFKLAAAPFHFWVADAYSSTSYTTFSFLNIVPKLPLLVILLKVYILISYAYDSSNLGVSFLYYTGIISILVGAYLALYQTNAKKVLVYSAISSTGYLILLVCTSIVSPEYLAFFLFFTIIYLIVLTCLIGLFSSHITTLRLRGLTSITELYSVWKLNPTRSVVLVGFLFAVIGMPPFINFLLKYWLLVSLIQHTGEWFSVFLILFSSILTAFYLLRFIKSSMFKGVSLSAGSLLLSPRVPARGFFQSYFIALLLSVTIILFAYSESLFLYFSFIMI